MATTEFKGNVVPLIINSADRSDYKDSTTDFNIKLRKSLRNITSVAVSDVVIPRNITDINVNNNKLSGAVIIPGTDPFAFEVLLTIGDYKEADLAAELQLQLDNATFTEIYGFTWVVAYDPVLGKIAIDLAYAPGALLDPWGIELNYTALIDVLGIGNGETSTVQYLVSNNDQLEIPTGRKVNLAGSLYYNITSDKLTENFNTSYVSSLNKFFNVGTGNNTLVLESDMKLENEFIDIPVGTGGDATESNAITISANGNIVVSLSDYTAFTYTRILLDGAWLQRTTPLVLPIAVPNSFEPEYVLRSIAISGDSNTLAVASNFNTFIYNRAGTEWLYDTTLPGTDTNEKQNALALSTNGNTLAIGSVNGARVCRIYVRSGGVWSLEETLPELVGPTGYFAFHVAISGDGNTLAIGGFEKVGIYTRLGTTWSTEQVLSLLTPTINDLALSANNGNTLVLGVDGVDTGVYTRSGTTWTAQNSILDGVNCWSVSISGAGDKIALSLDKQGTFYTYELVGGFWANQMSYSPSGYVNSGKDRIDHVRMSADGDYIAFGTGSDTILGSSWIYRDTGAWVLQGGKLQGENYDAAVRQGARVAMSRDAHTMAVASSVDNGDAGSVWIYTREEGITWTQQGEKITPSDFVFTFSNPGFESLSVSLSDDGDTLAVGNRFDTNTGVTRVYTRNNGVWSLQAKLIGIGYTGSPAIGALQGTSVSLSGDGSTLAIGGPDYSTATVILIGGTWIYTRTAGVWTQQVVLSPTVYSGNPLSGTSVGLSADGNTLITGGPNDSSNTGASWIAKRVNNVWQPMSTKLVASDITENKQGRFVSISGDGATAVVSAGNFIDSAVAIFVEVDGAWFQQGPKIKKTGEVSGNDFGASLSLSQRGDELVIGMPTQNEGGKSFVYLRNAGTWALDNVYFLADTVKFQTQGYSVSIAGDGLSFACGDPSAAGERGQAWWWVRAGDFSETFNIVIPTFAYTITDLVAYLDDTVLTNKLTLFATYDGTAVTLTIVGGSIVVQFVSAPSTTFDQIIWPSRVPAGFQTSLPIDFSINNNVIRTLTSRNFTIDNMIVDSERPQNFRKFAAGFTIDILEELDIQLRDERDRIVDLGGINWIMTMYCEIQI